jgi:phytanoyl-CoA hydroxylase
MSLSRKMNDAMADMNYSALRSQFETDGYVVLPEFVRRPQLENLQSKIDHFIRNVVPAMPCERVFFEDKQRPETLKQLQSLHEYDEYFAELFLEGSFPTLAAELLGDNVVPSNIQYFNKPPGVSQPTPAHQDGYYFKLQPCEALTMWLALDDVDEENGCLRYVRGSHRRGMRPHGRTNTLGFSQGITDFPRDEDIASERAVLAQPGDVIVHHAMTIHRADANRSTRSRRALGLIYYAASAREDASVKDAYHAELFKELKLAGKI